MENADVYYFIESFDFAENALEMRTLKRWNGRDLLHSENLSEHTHLVVAYCIKLYDIIKDKVNVNFESLIKLAMIHDSLEMLRGDILSITKDSIPNLRNQIEQEEKLLSNNIVKNHTELEYDIVDLADALACFKFIELEYSRPHNTYTDIAYSNTRDVASTKIHVFANKYNLMEQDLCC